MSTQFFLMSKMQMLDLPISQGNEKCDRSMALVHDICFLHVDHHNLYFTRVEDGLWSENS